MMTASVSASASVSVSAWRRRGSLDVEQKVMFLLGRADMKDEDKMRQVQQFIDSGINLEVS